MKNGFVETDSDCMQCRKDLGNREFLFIQVISSDEEGKYFVVADKEDLKEMSLNDIKTAVSGFWEWNKLTIFRSVNLMILSQSVRLKVEDFGTNMKVKQ